MTRTKPPALADLRAEIDRIDEAVHGLLMERGQIIERLIAAKSTAASGQAFRPGREASMMRRLAERHRGLLPLDTVEGIWRVIIATFTYVQAPFAVHADASGGDAAMRDSARFHFGFTVPYHPCAGVEAVIAAVAASRGDLGIVTLDGAGLHGGGGPWWEALRAPDAPKVIARLPFIERPDHPAGAPVLVLAQPLAEAAVRDVVLYAARVTRWPDDALGAERLAGAGDAVLVAAPGTLAREALAAAFSADLTEVGGHAARYRVS